MLINNTIFMIAAGLTIKLGHSLNTRFFLKPVRKEFCALSSVSSSRNRDGLGKPKGYLDPQARYKLVFQNMSGIPETSVPFIVLGIETSCDDTGVAVVRSDGQVLSNVVISQYSVHERFGGVVPGLAMEAHKNNIERALDEAIKNAGFNDFSQIDAIAVTKGPGLEICLRVGLRKAQALAREHKKPFVTVHHLEAHCLVARLAGIEVDLNQALPSISQPLTSNQHSLDSPETQQKNNIIPHIDSNKEVLGNELHQNNAQSGHKHFRPRVEYPFLSLLVSGGHTSLLVCHGLGNYSVIGGTLDDSLGEAFDKASRLLGLRTGGSGGAAIEKSALTGRTDAFEMRIPMRDKVNCDFSYAGLKNAFRVAVASARVAAGLAVTQEEAERKTNAPAGQMQESEELVVLPEDMTSDLSATFQSIALQHVEDRVARAMVYFEREVATKLSADQLMRPLTLVVVGGVAANQDLRRRLSNLITSTNKIHQNQKLQINQLRDPRDIDDGDVDSPPQGNLYWRLVCPSPTLCTDNGVMAAWAGIEKLVMGISDEIEGQEAVARWPIGTPIERKDGVFRRRDLINS